MPRHRMSAWVLSARRLRPSLARPARWLCACIALVVTLLAGNHEARAYSWMIRHGYSSCVPCHVDPSGAGTLSAYGRSIADQVMTMRFGDAPADEVATTAGFLWGTVPLPDALALQGDVRYLKLEQKVEGAPALSRGIWMQADLSAALKLGNFTAGASLGYADEGVLSASLTRAPEKNLVSRYHWLGYSFLDGALTVRAGRLNLPFGLRVIEHTLWARAYTRTSINDDQQYGVAAAYLGEHFRTELMAIAGNLLVHPANYRERGYSALFEWYAAQGLGLGASSLVTYRPLDALTLRPTYRQAHGVFARWATPWEPLVFLGELDYSLESSRYVQRKKGLVGFLQADLELVQGFHLLATGELSNVGQGGPPLSWGAWLSYAWFPLPHFDVRLDSLYQRLASSTSSTDVLTFLFQAHVYL
jgi:hypothetical protein